MKPLGPTATTRTSAARKRSRRLAAAPLALLLATIGCWTAIPASADDDKRPAEVTITVVDDPEQLKEKINKIQLPAMHEDVHAVQRTGKQPAPEKTSNTTAGQHRDETTEHHPTDPSTAAHHDTPEKPVNPGKVKEEIRHGESKLPR